MKTFDTGDYDKIKLVLNKYRNTLTKPVYFYPSLLNGLIKKCDFELIGHILDDFLDLFNQWVASVLLGTEVLWNGSKSALELKEHLLNTIEEKELPIDSDTFIDIIHILDISTMKRILTMKHIVPDEYKREFNESYSGLMWKIYQNRIGGMEMLKLLDQHYNIASNPELTKLSIQSIPMLEYLVYAHPQEMMLSAPTLLLYAAQYSKEEVVEYIMKHLGPFSQQILDNAVINAYSYGKANVVNLLKKYGANFTK
jgi:hypothetical protein